MTERVGTCQVELSKVQTSLAAAHAQRERAEAARDALGSELRLVREELQEVGDDKCKAEAALDREMRRSSALEAKVRARTPHARRMLGPYSFCCSGATVLALRRSRSARLA